MILARGPLRAMDSAEVVFNAASEPFAERFSDGYFTAGDGLAESRYVFVEGNHLPSRLATHPRNTFVIAELGFGTGLNFLASWQAFAEHGARDQRLHFWSVEKHPLTPDDLTRALAPWSELAPFATQLLADYPLPVPGIHRRHFDDGRVTLDLVWADVTDALEELASLQRPLIDAWFLDGFAPTRNPSMWQAPLFQAMATASHTGASVATFSAAGSVRRGLTDAGFKVQKRDGFGRKRESIEAVQEKRPAATVSLTPWDLPAREPGDGPRDAIVIGAGLAGAHVAAALAKRGTAVTVLDAGTIAGRASGNPQGVLFNRMSVQRSALADYSLHANLFASTRYASLFRDGQLIPGRDGALSGCLLTGDQARRVDADSLKGLQDVARVVDSSDAAQLLDAEPVEGGLWQPASGWLSPPRVSTALLDSPAITVREQCGTISLSRQDDSWRAVAHDGRSLATSPVVIIAAGVDSVRVAGVDHLPLGVVRGQTTQIPAPQGQGLAASLCHDGYIAPALEGQHCIGASFQPKDEGRELREADHRENIRRLAEALPAWAPYLQELDVAALDGRAELRCVSPDYLPVVGPLPDAQAFIETYGDLGKDATRIIEDRSDYLPGLYLSSGHGSRGLSYAALGAELIASQLWHEPLPVTRELQRALSPARFLLRAIIRNAL